MEVYIRDTCDACGGSGLNGMSYEEAKKQVTQCPTGVFIPNVTPLSSKEKIRNLMACPNCVHGKVDKWIDFEEFVSYIIT